jgi:Leucine-rich repeat (LRR) protein
VKTPVINFLKYCLSKTDLYKLNPNLQQEHDQVVDLSALDIKGCRYINLSNMKLKNIQNLGICEGLTTLVLSYNGIRGLGGYFPATLAKLDLSHNHLTDLGGLPPLPLLTYLDLSHNELAATEGLKEVVCMGVLQELNLKFNPLSTAKYSTVLQEVAALVPSLKTLNDVPVDELFSVEDKYMNDVTPEIIREPGRIVQAKILYSEHEWQAIESMSLAHCKLRSMKGLAGLTMLRSLNLSHNAIKEITDIASCKLLD